MIARYKTLIFDCDGVILDSNTIKSDAFYQVTLPYGKEYASMLLDFHINNGGVSRYEKFEYFKKNIAKDESINIDELLSEFAARIKKAMLTCDICSDLSQLKYQHIDKNWIVISGGNENEIKEIFEKRKILHLFNGGIYGSPKAKDTIFKKLLKKGLIKLPAIYFGDSRYDFEVAKKYDVDFKFIFGWTEVINWKSFTKKNSLSYVEKISDLVL